MKRFAYIINIILLTLNAALLIFFSAYTIIGSPPFGNYITEEHINTQLAFALIYEFIFVFVSKLISVKLKVDLSYKGDDAFSVIPKAGIICGVLLAAVLTAWTLIWRLDIKFSVTVIAMIFVILLEYGITKKFKASL